MDNSEKSKPEFRVIIAGTRDFSDYLLLQKKCDAILSAKRQDSKIIILSGTARGADRLGERYARERGYEIRQFPADWLNDDRKAGPIRNAKMADNADALIAFWDGESRGTRNMIDNARRKGLAVRTIIYSDMKKENMKQHLSDIDYVIDEDANAVIIEADEIDVNELKRLGKYMGGQVSTAKNGRIMFTFASAQEGHKFGASMVELAKARALGRKEAEKATLARISPASTDAKIAKLRADTSQYAIEHITGNGMHRGIRWLQDSFNDYYKAISTPGLRISEEADIAHRKILAQKVAIDCIHSLNREQLERLDGVLEGIAKEINISNGLKR